LRVESLVHADKLKVEKDVEYKTKIIFDNTTGGNEEPMIYWDNLLRKYMVTTIDTISTYELWHSGTFDPDDKVSKSGDYMSGNLTLQSTPSNDLHAVTKGYVDNIFSAYPDDPMSKSVYDVNDNGIVDLSEDAQKLGGQLPTYYATDAEIREKIDRGGDIMMGSLVMRGGFVSEAKSDLYDVVIKKSLIKAETDKAKITFQDTGYPNGDPGILWDSGTHQMRIEDHNNSEYYIWHSGNLNPNSINPVIRRTFIGDGSTTTFGIPEGYTPHNADVYYNGVRVFEGVDVDISSGNQIVFTEAPELDDRIDFMGYQTRLLGDNPSKEIQI
jgi:hypothetical protein